jgi:hypothetical protein
LTEYLSHALKSRSISLSERNVQHLKEMCAEVADSQESYSELLATRKASSNGTSTPMKPELAAEISGGDSAADIAKGGPTKHVLPDGQEIVIEGEGCAVCMCSTA